MKNKVVLEAVAYFPPIQSVHVNGRVSQLLGRNKLNLEQACTVINDGWDRICKTLAEKDGAGRPKRKRLEGKEVWDMTEENELEASTQYNELLEEESGVELITYDIKIIDDYAASEQCKLAKSTPMQFTCLEYFSHPTPVKEVKKDVEKNDPKAKKK